MKRREFLQSTLVAAGGVAFAGCPDDPNTPPVQYAPPQTHFPQSVASGDPHADSVMLWTRAWDETQPGIDLTVALEMALDDSFSTPVMFDGAPSMLLTAAAQWDGCLKVRVTGLDPATVYYYRFTYEGSMPCRTNTGRTKTAPAADADTPVSFAFVTCQDLKEGQYYNAYERLLEQHPDDLDFVVHLGDYIYEKATKNADVAAQGDRVIAFSDTAGALVRNEGSDDEQLTANSLDNYRELYRQYRSNARLQAVHEKYAFVQMWDDHEFANDCWGFNGTDLNGRASEADEGRRKRANQAWFEYQPVDFAQTDFVYEPSVAHPDDIRIYRDLRFGQHVHLVVTDLRSYRADHPVPEDALPGAVAVDEPTLTGISGGVLPADARPYVDIDAYDGGSLVAVLTGAASAVGYDAAKIGGLMSVDWINAVLTGLNDAGGSHTLIDATDQTLARGYAFIDLNKVEPYSELGARNLVAREPYEAYCRARYDATGGASEIVMGDAQKTWFFDTLENSTATFKVWANEYCLNHMGVDLSGLAFLPPAFQKRFYVICDDWTAFPNRKAEVLDRLSQIDDVIAITGDVHAFFAATPHVAGDPAKRIVEFVTSSISSSTIRTELVHNAQANATLRAAGADKLAATIDIIMQDPVTKPSPQLAYANVTGNGFSVMTVDGSGADVVMHRVDEAHLYTDLGANADDKWSSESFRVAKGAPDLLRGNQKWDNVAATWVDV